MYRITGIILAFLASSLIGIMKSNEIKRRKRVLDDFKELMVLISTKIGYFKEPLPVIFKNLLPETDSERKRLLEHCLMGFEMGEQDIGVIWVNAVENAYDSVPLTVEDRRVLSGCGQFLGQSDYESQKKHFSLLNQQLDRQIDDAAHQVITKGKMYSKIGVSLGALIAVALI